MNNSLFTTEPPSIPPQPELSPEEAMEEKIQDYLDEEKYTLGFVDFEAKRFRELIKNEENR